MSGHSHAKTIKKQKDAADLQRGKIFSKIGREISIAARTSADPKTNFKLRLAIEKAKQASMPKDNIQRAINKGSGVEGGERWEEISFEGYGPAGVAVFIEATTDNKNRTTAEIKNIFEKGSGNLASPGAVSFQFKKLGLIKVEKTGKPDKQILQLIDLGAEDIQETGEGIEMYVLPGNLSEKKDQIEKAGFTVKAAEVIRRPTNILVIDPANKEKVKRFLAALEEHDDVQRVYANVGKN